MHWTSMRVLHNWLCGLALAAVTAGAHPAYAQTGAPGVKTAVSAIPAPDQKDAIILAKPNRQAQPEQWEVQGDSQMVRNVTGSTLTPVLPDPSKATGAAVIVAPGGGFRILMMSDEGFKVAHWLADHGIAAFVLKYRLVPMPRDRAAFDRENLNFLMNAARNPGSIDPPADAVADALAALRMVRSRSAEWHVDPKKVGMMGFSAGAITTLGAALAPDAAARPDFIAPIYPSLHAQTVPADAPPMFLALAFDDPIFGVGARLDLIQSWRDARRPVEAHFYEKGSHGFATNHRSEASAMWMDEFIAWLKDRGIISK